MPAMIETRPPKMRISREWSAEERGTLKERIRREMDRIVYLKDLMREFDSGRHVASEIRLTLSWYECLLATLDARSAVELEAKRHIFKDFIED